MSSTSRSGGAAENASTASWPVSVARTSKPSSRSARASTERRSASSSQSPTRTEVTPPNDGYRPERVVDSAFREVYGRATVVLLVLLVVLLALPTVTADASPSIQVTITSGPSGTTDQTTATLTFEANEAGATFRCALDGSRPVACGSPVTYSGLADGDHLFRVEARDADADPATPARHAVKVRTKVAETRVRRVRLLIRSLSDALRFHDVLSFAIGYS